MRSLLSCGKTAVVAVAILMAAMSAYAGPKVKVLTDKGSYRAGETIELSLGGENHDEPLSVDVYVGLIGRDGALYTLGEAGWGAYLEPWMADVLVPNPYYMAPVAFQWFAVPCAMPPVGEVGEYSFAAGLTQPGTLDFVAEISFAPFTIEPRELHIYVNSMTGDDASDGTSDSPFKTITHALASVSGSEAQPVTIHVAAGTYSKSTNGEWFPLNMKSWVSLSGDGADITILDAEKNAYHVIYSDDTHHLTIENFTITGGCADGTSRMQYGGGICCCSSSALIRSNVITGNSAKSGGGGINCDISSAVLENNYIAGNSALYGGGIGADCYTEFFDWTYSGSPVVRGNTIVNNSAELGGGAVHFYRSSPEAVIEGNLIEGNSATSGGGIYCYNDCSPTISDNLLSGNRASEMGGGIYCEYHCSPEISGNSIECNSADGFGGGIYCDSSSPAILDNLFLDNSAALEGGGLYCEYVSSPSIENNIFEGNSAGERGGGISCKEYSSPDIVSNTIFSNWTCGKGGGIYVFYDGSRPRIQNCILWGNGEDISEWWGTYCCIEDLSDGLGNIHDDPVFVSGPLGGFYLDPRSPCIDAGSMSAEDAGLSNRTTQADDTPDTGILDIGYHYRIDAPSRSKLDSNAPIREGQGPIADRVESLAKGVVR